MKKPFEDLVILDLETTGLNNPTGSDQIIQVGWYKKVSEGWRRGSFYVQLEEGRELTPFITELTGITADKLTAESGARTTAEARAFISGLTAHCVVICQSVSFDMSFLPELTRDFYCTRTISYLLAPEENPSLQPTLTRLGILFADGTSNIPKAHDALYDSHATWKLFMHYLHKIGESAMLKYKNTVVDTDKRPLTWVPNNAIVLDRRTGGTN